MSHRVFTILHSILSGLVLLSALLAPGHVVIFRTGLLVLSSVTTGFLLAVWQFNRLRAKLPATILPRLMRHWTLSIIVLAALAAFFVFVYVLNLLAIRFTSCQHDMSEMLGSSSSSSGGMSLKKELLTSICSHESVAFWIAIVVLVAMLIVHIATVVVYTRHRKQFILTPSSSSTR